MNRLVFAAVVLSFSAVFGQEIGAEIQPPPPPPPPPPVAVPQNTNPAFNPNRGSVWGQPGAVSPKATPQVSAGKGQFGARVSTMSASLVSPPAAGAAAASGYFNFVPTMGFSYWLDNEFSFLFDLGGGFGLFNGPNLYWNLGATLGIDYHFRKIGDAIRPLFNLQVGVALPLNAAADTNNAVQSVTLLAQVGGGAEYFFSPNFAVYGKFLLALGYGYDVRTGIGHLGLNTSPAVGASWYF
jgi:hypothetical protein